MDLIAPVQTACEEDFPKLRDLGTLDFRTHCPVDLASRTTFDVGGYSVRATCPCQTSDNCAFTCIALMGDLTKFCANAGVVGFLMWSLILALMTIMVLVAGACAVLRLLDSPSEFDESATEEKEVSGNIPSLRLCGIFKRLKRTNAFNHTTGMHD